MAMNRFNEKYTSFLQFYNPFIVVAEGLQLKYNKKFFKE
jgi:hypothetical protein